MSLYMSASSCSCAVWPWALSWWGGRVVLVSRDRAAVVATPGDRMLEDPIQKPEGGGAVAKEGEEEALQSHPWGRPLNPTGPAGSQDPEELLRNAGS